MSGPKVHAINNRLCKACDLTHTALTLLDLGTEELSCRL